MSISNWLRIITRNPCIGYRHQYIITIHTSKRNRNENHECRMRVFRTEKNVVTVWRKNNLKHNASHKISFNETIQWICEWRIILRSLALVHTAMNGTKPFRREWFADRLTKGTQKLKSFKRLRQRSVQLCAYVWDLCIHLW